MEHRQKHEMEARLLAPTIREQNYLQKIATKQLSLGQLQIQTNQELQTTTRHVVALEDQLEKLRRKQASLKDGLIHLSEQQAIHANAMSDLSRIATHQTENEVLSEQLDDMMREHPTLAEVLLNQPETSSDAAALVVADVTHAKTAHPPGGVVGAAEAEESEGEEFEDADAEVNDGLFDFMSDTSDDDDDDDDDDDAEAEADAATVVVDSEAEEPDMDVPPVDGYGSGVDGAVDGEEEAEDDGEDD